MRPLLCPRCAWRARCRSSSHHPPLLSRWMCAWREFGGPITNYICKFLSLLTPLSAASSSLHQPLHTALSAAVIYALSLAERERMMAQTDGFFTCVFISSSLSFPFCSLLLHFLYSLPCMARLIFGFQPTKFGCEWASRRAQMADLTPAGPIHPPTGGVHCAP